MLLQHIVETLDAELDRLHRLRSIIAGISGTVEVFAPEPVPVVEAILAAAPEAVQVEALPAPEIKSTPRRKRVATASTRVKKLPEKKPESAALSGTIPSGPVVVSRAALAKENAAKQDGTPKQQHVPAPPPGSLGKMIRALRLDGTA